MLRVDMNDSLPRLVFVEVIVTLPWNVQSVAVKMPSSTTTRSVVRVCP